MAFKRLFYASFLCSFSWAGIFALLPNAAASNRKIAPNRKNAPGKYIGADLLVKYENIAVDIAGPIMAESPVTPERAPCKYPCSDSSI